MGGNINSPHLPQHQRRHHRRPSPTTTNTRVSGAEHHREGLYEITRNLVLEGTLRKDRDSVTLATGEVKRGIIPVAHSGTGIVEGWSGFTRLPLTWELRCFALVSNFVFFRCFGVFVCYSFLLLAADFKDKRSFVSTPVCTISGAIFA